MSLQHTSGITEVLWLLEHEMQIQSEPRDLLVGSIVKQVQLPHLRHRVDLLPQLLHCPFGVLEILLDYPTYRGFPCPLSDIFHRREPEIHLLPMNLNLISILSLFRLDLLFLFGPGLNLAAFFNFSSIIASVSLGLLVNRTRSYPGSNLRLLIRLSSKFFDDERSSSHLESKLIKSHSMSLSHIPSSFNFKSSAMCSLN